MRSKVRILLLTLIAAVCMLSPSFKAQAQHDLRCNVTMNSYCQFLSVAWTLSWYSTDCATCLTCVEEAIHAVDPTSIVICRGCECESDWSLCKDRCTDPH